MKPHLHKVPGGWQIWDSRKLYLQWASTPEHGLVPYKAWPVTGSTTPVKAYKAWQRYHREYPLA